MSQIGNQSAVDVSLLAHRLADGYLAYKAAILVVADPRSDSLMPQIKVGDTVPIGELKSKDGNRYTKFHFPAYLDKARTDPTIVAELEHIWFTGAFLTLGDALAQNKYFDRSPILELIRHLRNGIAHGNKFNITNPASLIQYPAHNRNVTISDSGPILEITPALHGTKVLFDFLEVGDIYILLLNVGFYLNNLNT